MSEGLQPRLIKGLQAEYVPAQWTGDNPSGLTVYGKNLLVLVDECAARSSGGIELPGDLIERMNEASVTGAIFDVGPEAFRRFDDGTLWTGSCPEVGQRIVFEKYAGTLVRGADARQYRILDYRAVAAGIIPGSET